MYYVLENASKTKKKRLELPIDGSCSGISVMFEEGGALSQNRVAPQRLNHGIIRNVSRPPSDETILISDDSNDSTDSSVQVIHFKCFQVHVIEIFTHDFTI